MSGFYGLFRRDAIPLASNIAETMFDAISRWQPDDSGKWQKDCAALGHSMLWNTPQSKLEKLPQQQGNLLITMDARLDDRQGLVEMLDLSNCTLETFTDSDLILNAYNKWGSDCPRYLLGDFAFAIWDTEKQQFFCARDHVGVKQLYFHLTQSFFAFSNDLEALAGHPAIPTITDDIAVANFLVHCELIHKKRTFFKAIKKLQPAHSLTVTSDLTECTCYWNAKDAPKANYKDQESCSDKLRELLHAAVSDRLRSAYPVASHLSGGIDSSAIAVIAARTLKKSNKTLFGFNWLQEPSPASDFTYYEWANSKRIADLEGITHNYVFLTKHDVYQQMCNHTMTYGKTTLFWYESIVHKATREKGARTILSGWGGDELASYHGQSYYSDLIIHGKLHIFLKALIRYGKEEKLKFWRRIVAILYHKVLLVFIPQLFSRYLPRNRNVHQPNLRFIKRDFQTRYMSEWKKATFLTSPRAPTIREDMLHYLDLGHIQSRIESWATGAIPNRLEYSYPLLDKRIIEFVLNLPAECFVEKGKKRYLYRRAIKDLLPEEILWGNTKKEPQRVKQLVSHTLYACKRMMYATGGQSIQSDYIDVKALTETVSTFSISELHDTSSQLVIDIEKSLATICAFGRD